MPERFTVRTDPRAIGRYAAAGLSFSAVWGAGTAFLIWRAGHLPPFFYLLCWFPLVNVLWTILCWRFWGLSVDTGTGRFIYRRFLQPTVTFSRREIVSAQRVPSASAGEEFINIRTKTGSYNFCSAAMGVGFLQGGGVCLHVQDLAEYLGL